GEDQHAGTTTGAAGNKYESYSTANQYGASTGCFYGEKLIESENGDFVMREDVGDGGGSTNASWLRSQMLADDGYRDSLGLNKQIGMKSLWTRSVMDGPSGIAGTLVQDRPLIVPPPQRKRTSESMYEPRVDHSRVLSGASFCSTGAASSCGGVVQQGAGVCKKKTV
ncbi:unnamed protein product, partial [Amoebophrya sp. A120]